jgi:hypothetical protein
MEMVGQEYVEINTAQAPDVYSGSSSRALTEAR